MQNPRLAGRYAKSLLDLALEKDQLEQIFEDMVFLQGVCRSSRDFVNLLRSPIIKADKKFAIIEAVTAKRICELTAAFNQLLVHKGREMYLPEIISEFINQYKEYKGIYTVKLNTAVPVSEDLKQEIVSKVQAETPMKRIELLSAVDPSLIGGFTLQMGDRLVDASIAYDLNKVKAQFLNNDFIYKIR